MTTKTSDRAKATPGPWRDPYVDPLPNGLRAVRIDSAQATGVSVIALLPIGDGSDLEINAIQHANARLIAEAPAMAALLRQIASEDPVADNPDEGDTCFYCGDPRGIHRANCAWLEANAVIARIDGGEV